MVDFTKPTIEVTLRRGTEVRRATVYTRYGRARERLVQEICDLVKGRVVYFCLKRDGCTMTVVPVTQWTEPKYAGEPGGSGGLAGFTPMFEHPDFGSAAVLEVMGHDRRPWRVEASNPQSGAQSPDSDQAEIENAAVAAPSAGPGSDDGRLNTIRREF